MLGQAAAASIFGTDDPVGRFVKVNQQWFRVIGVAGPQLAAQTDMGGLPAQDRNNVIYVPLMAAMLRVEDSQSFRKDEIDGIYLALRSERDVTTAGAIVRGLLDASHRGAGDFSVLVPAELLAEQQRTRRIFQVVMVAIASISLLVGGIGIMNIMLASVLERTREIGVRRAVGARRVDIIRQFLIETTLITTTGGVLGIVLGRGAVAARGLLRRVVHDRVDDVDPAGVLRLRLGRAHLRRLPGHARVEPRPGLRAALRVARVFPPSRKRFGGTGRPASTVVTVWRGASPPSRRRFGETGRLSGRRRALRSSIDPLTRARPRYHALCVSETLVRTRRARRNGRREAMRSRLGIVILVLGLAVMAIGCGAPPTADIDAAKAAVANAASAGASQYAADSLKAAEDAQAALDAELKAQDGNWFKSYDKAKQLALAAKEAGDKATAETVAGKEKAAAAAAKEKAEAEEREKAAAAAVRVGGQIKAPTKTKDVKPMYPAEAQSAKVSGSVIIEATIGADGKVINAKVLRSVAKLDQAALDAVKQWEYSPTLLNGKPVPVKMTVTVTFKLD